MSERPAPRVFSLNNPNALVAENSWNTQKDVEAGLVGVYHTLYNCYWNSFNAFQLSGQSDEFYSLSPDADLASYVNLKYTNYDQRWNINSWTYLYQSVFRSNQVIIYADRVEWESEVKKNQVVAQARAMRGMSYYNLAMLYKKAPIVDWISAPGDQPKEASFEELVDFIEKDFLFAAENLPAKWPEVGRFTKWFAYDFLGKLYMNSGQWEKAKAAFEKVIESKQFRLAPNYSDNFRHETNNNCESIFEIQNSDRNDTWGGFWELPMTVRSAVSPLDVMSSLLQVLEAVSETTAFMSGSWTCIRMNWIVTEDTISDFATTSCIRRCSMISLVRCFIRSTLHGILPSTETSAVFVNIVWIIILQVLWLWETILLISGFSGMVKLS